MMNKENPFQSSTSQYEDDTHSISKPFSSETCFFKAKEWTLQEQIYHKLQRIAEFLKGIYPKLTAEFTNNIKNIVEDNIKTVIQNLELIEKSLNQDPSAFHTVKLDLNQHHINELKHVCDTLQSAKSYEYEEDYIGSVKQALYELEHLIQHPSLVSKSERAQSTSEPKILGVRIKTLSAKVPIKIKKTAPAPSKKPEVASKVLKTKGTATKKAKVSAPKAKPIAKKTAAKKPGLQKAAVKKVAVPKKTAGNKAAVKKPVVKKAAVKKAVVKKPLTKKPVVKKVVVKKAAANRATVAKKPVVKKPAVKKPVAKKAAVKKAAVKKPVIKKLGIKKPAVKKAAVKKPVAKKSVVKKPAAKKTVARKSR